MLKTDKIPADLELKYNPRRVYRRCDVKRGETIRFTYMDGEDAMKERTVLVLESDDNHVKGICLERDGEFRNYIWDKARNISVVPPFVKKNVSVSYEPVSLSDYMKAMMAR